MKYSVSVEESSSVLILVEAGAVDTTTRVCVTLLTEVEVDISWIVLVIVFMEKIV